MVAQSFRNILVLCIVLSNGEKIYCSLIYHNFAKTLRNSGWFIRYSRYRMENLRIFCRHRTVLKHVKNSLLNTSYSENFAQHFAIWYCRLIDTLVLIMFAFFIRFTGWENLLNSMLRYKKTDLCDVWSGSEKTKEHFGTVDEAKYNEHQGWGSNRWYSQNSYS